MPFVKIDCGMINSTIWYDHDARIIFLTALLMAEPREYEVDVPQLAVRDLQPVNWSAPAGWYGFVPSSAQGIISRAGNVALEAGYAALERLGSPEKESRSPLFDGRRMIRVDGGYLILNYDRFRQRDYSAAERQRKWREKNRTVTRDVTSPTRHITQAEAEAEAEAEKQKRPKPLVADAPRKSSAREKVEAFVVEERHRLWAKKNAPSVPIDVELDAWKDRCRTSGYRTKQGPIADAQASFYTSMRNAEAWGTYRKGASLFQQSPTRTIKTATRPNDE